MKKSSAVDLSVKIEYDICHKMQPSCYMKEMGDQVQMEMTPLRSYAGLATDLKQRVDAGDDAIFEDTPTVPKAGLFYWITFNIEYPGKIGVSGVSV